MNDRLLLTMDGSTRACGVALLRLRGAHGEAAAEWEVLAGRTEVDGSGQAKFLLGAVDALLEEIGAGPSDLRAIVVGTGPGTFTGVRIAVATARALALALSVPVVGVSTLSALAAGVLSRAATAEGGESAVPQAVVPVVDARRGQVFYGLYTVVAEGDDGSSRRWRRGLPFAVCGPGELVAAIGEGKTTVWLVGECASAKEALPPGWTILHDLVAPDRLVVGQAVLEEPGESPQGSRLGPWLRRVLESEGVRRPATVGAVGTPESVKPIYVRSPDADVHITKMKDPWGHLIGAV